VLQVEEDSLFIYRLALSIMADAKKDEPVDDLPDPDVKVCAKTCSMRQSG